MKATPPAAIPSCAIKPTDNTSRGAVAHPFRFAMGDQRTPRLNFLNALARTIHLARRLRPYWEGQEKVGILLPPSIGGALVNIAANIAQLAQAFRPTATDGFLGTLPFFHSFGFTGALALTGTLGLGVAYA